MKYFVDCLKKYAVFSGRSHRKEFWMFVLISFIINFVLNLLNLDIIAMLCSLAILVPSWAVSVRRMHDINKSGWWVLIGLIPIIGWIIFIVLASMKGDQGDNRFGAPLAYIKN